MGNDRGGKWVDYTVNHIIAFFDFFLIFFFIERDGRYLLPTIVSSFLVLRYGHLLMGVSHINAYK